MVIGPGGRSEAYPVQPPRRAMIQASQAIEWPGCGFFLLGSLSFETDLQGLEHRQLIRRDHVGGRAIDGAVTSEHELHDLGCCDHRDGGEIEQRLGGFDLTALEVEPLTLTGAKQLLDMPSLTIPSDGISSSCFAPVRVRGSTSR